MKDMTKIRFLVLAAVATTTMAPAAATAQGSANRAEVMTAVAQLHQAQMAVRMPTTGKICFNLLVVSGCVAW